MYICIYVSAGPLWATRLRGILFQSSNITSFNQSNIAILEIYSLAMLCNVANLQVHPLDASYLRSYSIEACILQPECFDAGSLLPS